MGGYVVNFTVYTMAMIGLICFAVFVYKKIMDGSIRRDNSQFLSLEESMSLTPRKTLHVVRAGNERFLIASDVDRTTLISKLGGNVQKQDLPDFNEVLKAQNQEPQIRLVQEPQISTALPMQEHEIPVEPQIARRNRPPRRVDRAAGMSVDFPKPIERSGKSIMRAMAQRINEL